MILYSQRDPAYRDEKLGASKLTMAGYGCLVASLATLYQKSPTIVLKIAGAIDSNGNSRTSLIAKECGGQALPATTVAPKGWCIAMTDKYAPQVPTHFFCVNMDTKEQIDPLDYPAKPEPLTYKIVHFRPFTNILLPAVIAPEPPAPFPDVPLDRWSAKDIAEAKMLGWIGGYPDGTFKPTQPMTREEVVALVMKATKV